MNAFLLLAQAPLIGTDTSFTVPILVLLLGLAGALAEARWRVGQAERHADKQDERAQWLEARLTALAPCFRRSLPGWTAPTVLVQASQLGMR